jgi:hypothetical protein
MATVQVFLTKANTSPWTVPSDFASLVSVETLPGGGSGGACRGGSGVSAAGGGGGEYRKSTGAQLSGNIGNGGTPWTGWVPGTTTVPFVVGAGGTSVAVSASTAVTGNNGGDTAWGGTTLASISSTTGVGSGGGKGGGAATSGGCSGGAAGTGGVGNTVSAGGRGGNVSSGVRGGSGGGGAGGPNGAGNQGGDAITAVGTNGGSGDAGSGGAGGTLETSGTGVAGAGGTATEFNASHGCGGGGGGSGGSGNGATGGAGGEYGGGGGAGCGSTGTLTSGAGGDGLIVITYTQAVSATLTLPGTACTTSAGSFTPSITDVPAGAQSSTAAGIFSIPSLAFPASATAASSAGAFLPSISAIYLIGGQVTSASNTFIGAIPVALLGVGDVVSAAGLLSTQSINLGGVQSTAQIGTLIPSILNIALTGVQSTSAAGILNLIISTSVSLIGAQITSAASAISTTVSDTYSLPGVGTATSAGALTLTTAETVSVSGAFITSSAGILQPIVAPIGVGSQLTSSAGTITPSISAIALPGASSSSAAGILNTASLLSNFTGTSITSSIGNLMILETLSGVQAVSAAETISSITSGLYGAQVIGQAYGYSFDYLIGVIPSAQANSAAGMITTFTIPLMGVAATSAIGSLQPSITSITLTGVAGVSGSGLLVGLRILPSIQITSTANPLYSTISAVLSGAAIASSAGNLTPILITTSVIGVVGNSAVGGFIPLNIYVFTGVQSICQAGSVSLLLSDVLVGAQSNSVVGNLFLIGDGTSALSGVSITSTAGALVSTIPVAMAGAGITSSAAPIFAQIFMNSAQIVSVAGAITPSPGPLFNGAQGNSTVSALAIQNVPNFAGVVANSAVNAITSVPISVFLGGYASILAAGLVGATTSGPSSLVGSAIAAFAGQIAALNLASVGLMSSAGGIISDVISGLPSSSAVVQCGITFVERPIAGVIVNISAGSMLEQFYIGGVGGYVVTQAGALSGQFIFPEAAYCMCKPYALGSVKMIPMT